VQKYFENKGKSPMYVGNTMIPPGEGKMVEVPTPRATVAPAAPQGPSLVELIAKLLGKALAQILPDLPGMTNEALDLAESQERAGKNRKTLLEAIQAERIERANAKLQKEQDEAAAAALKAANDALMSAKLALANLPEDAPERTAAQAAVAEAQAKVDALTQAQD
jgi:hypothetical protein